jgi:hypothetical protein
MSPTLHSGLPWACVDEDEGQPAKARSALKKSCTLIRRPPVQTYRIPTENLRAGTDGSFPK